MLVLGLLLLAAFAHTVHACPVASDLAGSGNGSAGAPCMVCLAMQAIALILVFVFVSLTPLPIQSFALIPIAPTRPAFRLSSFTRPPPTF